jgi:hypothetical protein
MKILIPILTIATFLFASPYYAKLEPIDTYSIKAATSGQVVFSNDNLKGKYIKDSVIIKLDKKYNEIDLKQSLLKLDILNKIIKIEQNTYQKFLKIKAKSQIEKDAQHIKVLNLQSTKSDLMTKIALLKDTILKKTITVKNLYINDIKVLKGDYVNPGTVLLTASDFSKGKLEVFIPINEASTIKDKKIYLDGKLTNYHINKIYKIADSVHISSYRCQIDIDHPKQFSKLVKIEFK